MLAPIILFAYNRPDHLKRTIESLQQNTLAKESILYVFIDGAKPGHEQLVREVEEYIHTVRGFLEVHITKRETNFGLGRSIIEGVNSIFEKYEKLVVLEDDLVTSPYFLKYINDGLSLYENEMQVMSIVGYNYPITVAESTYFLNNSDCLGWATWRNRWVHFEPDSKKLYDEILEKKLKSRFNMDNSYPFFKLLTKVVQGKNSSWAIRWYASVFLKGGLTLYPSKSLLKHIGNDAGTNMSSSNFLDTEVSFDPVEIKQIPLQENKQARKNLANYFWVHGRLIGLIWNKIHFQIMKLFR